MQNNTETPTNNATQTDSGEKLFTQEQVNQIVSERLARERGKAATEQAAADKASDIARREQVLKCREFVADNKQYPAKLLEVLDTSNFDSFKAQADKLLEAFPHLGSTFKTVGAYTPTPPARVDQSADDLIRKAFRNH